MPIRDASRIQKVTRIVTDLCHKRRLTMYQIDGRRQSDVIGFCVWGDRHKVLNVPAQMLELVKTEDLEIWQSGRRGIDYVLVFMVTEKLLRQSLIRSERRTKLIMRKNRYLPALRPYAEAPRNNAIQP